MYTNREKIGKGHPIFPLNRGNIINFPLNNHKLQIPQIPHYLTPAVQKSYFRGPKGHNSNASKWFPIERVLELNSVQFEDQWAICFHSILPLNLIPRQHRLTPLAPACLHLKFPPSLSPKKKTTNFFHYLIKEKLFTLSLIDCSKRKTSAEQYLCTMEFDRLVNSGNLYVSLATHEWIIWSLRKPNGV